MIQDLPFGRRKLRLTSGEEIDVPNVIRLLIPSRLVDTSDFAKKLTSTHFERELYSRLSQSVAERGLDNFLAEGTKAFAKLKSIVDTIPRDELDDKQATELKETLVNFKQYLKGDYNVRTIIIFTQKIDQGPGRHKIIF